MTEQLAFNNGDVVRLTSSEIEMTVSAQPGEPPWSPSGYSCQWLDEALKLQEGVFPEEALLLIRRKADS